MTTDTSVRPIAAFVDRDVVVVRGSDATSFLQSLVSQDLDPVEVGASVHSLLLAPQGKLVVDFYAVRVQSDEWWCVCEGGFGAVLAGGLDRFKIRVKAEVESHTTNALAVRGLGAPEDALGALVYPVEWGGAPAFDALGERSVLDELPATLGCTLVARDSYERARVEAGVPRMGAELDERLIPQEAGLERDAVSFTKGCFVGQELVCRIDTRGHVNRLLRRLRADSELRTGADVRVDDRVVGTITTAAGDTALAFIRREVTPGAEVIAGLTTARVEAVF